MNLIILGPQGSGKDTQAEKIAKHFNFELILMGQFLREVAKMNTPLGKEVYRYQNVLKEMVPGRIVREVLHIKLVSMPREQGIIFEGVPRTMDQAKYIEEVALESGREIDKIIYVNVSEKETIKRISKRWICKKCKKMLIMGKDIKNKKEQCPHCGGDIMQRIDDTPSGIDKRLQVFRNETLPVIDYFKKQGKLIEINGEQTIEEVFKEILGKIGQKE